MSGIILARKKWSSGKNAGFTTVAKCVLSIAKCVLYSFNFLNVLVLHRQACSVPPRYRFDVIVVSRQTTLQCAKLNCITSKQRVVVLS